MPIISTHCSVLHAQVNRLADFEGHTSRIFCPEYLETGECRLKREAVSGGPLSQFLERVSEERLDRSGYRCNLG